MVYLLSGYFPDSWTGFSPVGIRKPICLRETFNCISYNECYGWYSAKCRGLRLVQDYTAVIILVGYLRNPDMEIAAISIWFSVLPCCLKLLRSIQGHHPIVLPFLFYVLTTKICSSILSSMPPIEIQRDVSWSIGANCWVLMPITIRTKWQKEVSLHHCLH